MKKNVFLSAALFLLSLTAMFPVLEAQNSVKEIKRQKQEAEKEIKETRTALGANEQKVTESMEALRQIDDEIAASRQEIETVQGQLEILKDTISALEAGIEVHEGDLTQLRDEYLKSVKKMRVARKRNSGAVFLFASKSLGEAKRRMRYMREFSDWKNRRTDEISRMKDILHGQRQQLVQAHEDVAVALQREQHAQNALTLQRERQQATVKELRANSEALKSKLARRQAEARQLGNQISQVIAEQQAKEAQLAAARKKAEEERKLAEQKAAAERRAAEERRLAEQKAAEQKQLAIGSQKKKDKEDGASRKESASAKKNEKEVAQDVTPDRSEYAVARRRRSRNNTTDPSSVQPAASSSKTKDSHAAQTSAPVSTESGFGGMKGNLPKPVGGSFKIVSAFGRHPVSPELPDIMDENLGIDAHVANGAAACAVYEGDVIKVYDRTTTTGFRNIIVVKHGDYITVYANLETLAVKTGQHVKQGQNLGTVGADFDNPKHGMIHFEVWKNQTRLDPAAWIRN